MKVVAIDPGIANTGVGVVEFGHEPRILAATTVTTSPTTTRGNNTRQRTKDTWSRVLEIVSEVDGILNAFLPELVGIELFSDQGAARKQFSGRGDTAMLVGALVSHISSQGHVFCPLDSTVVASGHGAMREQVEWWKAGKETGIEGEEFVVGRRASVHAREAVAHALFLGRTYKLLGEEGVYALW